ncbi:MAG TPA: peptidoglycan recognition family protein [Blastocatellia bacterium]|nr:peptidoglycan recognition family protein [Blastocatellia bacterium]
MSGFSPQDERYAKLVDHYARYIQSPVLRLKFLNNTLRAAPPRDFWARLPMVGTLPERAALIFEVSKLMPPASSLPVALRITSLLYRLRYAVYALSLILAIGTGASVIYAAMRLATSMSPPKDANPNAPDRIAGNSDGANAVAAIGTEAGLSLDKVWLAESGDGFEFYSNGARVLTEFEIDGKERRFYSFNADALFNDSESFDQESKPIGILYHISESDLLPFAGKYNSSLQGRSRALLEYAREKALYNYLIDRFGRTYRIVRDEQTANHAGNSVWSDGERVYVNLSASFIGICFEGKSEVGAAVGPEGINEAQIYAARVLTAVLRSKYGIADANCVTHGLVSVNPSNRLMGYHTDWVAGFPFEAVGLSNKYETELVTVSRLGFAYDQPYIAAAGGKRWAGLERADARLKEAAAVEGVSVEVARREGWKVFQRAHAKQREIDNE